MLFSDSHTLRMNTHKVEPEVSIPQTITKEETTTEAARREVIRASDRRRSIAFSLHSNS
jgi:hypothetical protein